MAEAFITATAKAMQNNTVDHQSGKGNWIARRVALNATERGAFGIVTEFDRLPQRHPAAVQTKPKITMSQSLDRAAALLDAEVPGID
jgi:hypothetical protein